MQQPSCKYCSNRRNVSFEDIEYIIEKYTFPLPHHECLKLVYNILTHVGIVCVGLEAHILPLEALNPFQPDRKVGKLLALELSDSMLKMEPPSIGPGSLESSEPMSRAVLQTSASSSSAPDAWGVVPPEGCVGSYLSEHNYSLSPQGEWILHAGGEPSPWCGPVYLEVVVASSQQPEDGGPATVGQQTDIEVDVKGEELEVGSGTHNEEQLLEDQLGAHMQTREDKKYSCIVCKKWFDDASALSNHSYIHTDDKPYACQVCCKRYGRSSQLTYHMLTHSGAKQHQCEVCGKRFGQLSALKVHGTLHEGVKPFQCEVCSKQFSQHGNLVKHLRTHTGERPFECSVCRKRFNVSSDLAKHHRVHTGEKPYRCAVCNKRFTSSHGLVAHGRIHTGEKPFQCVVCNKRFRCHSFLVGHKQTHTGQKPYRCDLCDKWFSQASTLYTHKKIHSAVKQSECELCGRQFKQSTYLKKHLQKLGGRCAVGSSNSSRI